MKYCEKCGAQLMDNVAFCQKCGAKQNLIENSEMGYIKDTTKVSSKNYFKIVNIWQTVCCALTLIAAFMLLSGIIFVTYDMNMYAGGVLDSYTRDGYVFVLAMLAACFAVAVFAFVNACRKRRSFAKAKTHEALLQNCFNKKLANILGICLTVVFGAVTIVLFSTVEPYYELLYTWAYRQYCPSTAFGLFPYLLPVVIAAITLLFTAGIVMIALSAIGKRNLQQFQPESNANVSFLKKHLSAFVCVGLAVLSTALLGIRIGSYYDPRTYIMKASVYGGYYDEGPTVGDTLKKLSDVRWENEQTENSPGYSKWYYGCTGRYRGKIYNFYFAVEKTKGVFPFVDSYIVYYNDYKTKQNLFEIK